MIDDHAASTTVTLLNVTISDCAPGHDTFFLSMQCAAATSPAACRRTTGLGKSESCNRRRAEASAAPSYWCW